LFRISVNRSVRSRSGFRQNGRPRRGKGRKTRLYSGDEGAVRGDVAIRHARGVEGEAWIAVTVEEDEAAGGAGAVGAEMDGLPGDKIGGGPSASNGGGGGHAGCGAGEENGRGLGPERFQGGFRVAQ